MDREQEQRQESGEGKRENDREESNAERGRFHRFREGISCSDTNRLSLSRLFTLNELSALQHRYYNDSVSTHPSVALSDNGDDEEVDELAEGMIEAAQVRMWRKNDGNHPMVILALLGCCSRRGTC